MDGKTLVESDRGLEMSPRVFVCPGALVFRPRHRKAELNPRIVASLSGQGELSPGIRRTIALEIRVSKAGSNVPGFRTQVTSPFQVFNRFARAPVSCQRGPEVLKTRDPLGSRAQSAPEQPNRLLVSLGIGKQGRSQAKLPQRTVEVGGSRPSSPVQGLFVVPAPQVPIHQAGIARDPTRVGLDHPMKKVLAVPPDRRIPMRYGPESEDQDCQPNGSRFGRQRRRAA